MPIDWEKLAGAVGDLNPDGSEGGSGTSSGQRALELLLGEENIRDAVDYWTTLEPGAFTAESVLKIIGSWIAMERCYEIYKTEPRTERAARALFLLAGIADDRALPWIVEFFNDDWDNARWHGLVALQNILYGPLNDEDLATVQTLLRKGASDVEPRLKERATKVLEQLTSYTYLPYKHHNL